MKDAKYSSKVMPGSCYLELAMHGKNDWWRYIFTPVLGVAFAVLAVLVLQTFVAFVHALPLDIAAQIGHPEHAVPFYLGIGVCFGILTVGLMLATSLVHRKAPTDLIGRWRWLSFFFGFGAWVSVQVFLALIDFAAAPQGFTISAGPGTARLAVAAMFGLLLQTFTEEVIFRGYLTQGLLLFFRRPLRTAIVSGLVFGACHLPNGFPQVVNAVAFGIVCAMIAIRTGGIATTFGLHLANNYFGAVMVVLGGDVFRGSPGIFTQNAPQLVWLDICLGIVALVALQWLIFRRPFFDEAPAG